MIKSSLRSTMLDGWFSTIMILASKKDIVEQLHVIDSFAGSSAPLQKLLLQTYGQKYTCCAVCAVHAVHLL